MGTRATRESGSFGAEIPWLTLALVAGCIAASAHDLVGASGVRTDLDLLLEESVDYFESHPYLEPPAILVAQLGEEAVEQQRLRFEQQRSRRSAPPIPAGVVRRSQEHLEELVFEALASLEPRPVQEWGVQASRWEPAALWGHSLFHSSWLHLLGACFFLVVLGFHLEGAWGRLFYACFLIGAAPAAAAAFSLANPEATALFVGSSGLMAALLGAFAVRFRGEGHEGVWGLLVVSGALWLALPAWAGFEWSLTSGLAPGPLRFSGPGPTYWAFGAGAGYGVAVACAVALLRLEAAFVAPKRDARRTQVSKTILEMAMAERASGHPERAFGTLSRCLKRHPDDVDVALALWDVAGELRRSSEAAHAMLLVIRDELRRGDTASAVDHWLELEESGLALGADLNLLMKMSTVLRRFGRSAAALQALRRAWERADGSPAMAARLAREIRELDPDGVGPPQPVDSVHLDDRAERSLPVEPVISDGALHDPALLAPAATDSGETAERPEPIDIGSGGRPLRVRNVRPLELREEGLFLENETGRKRFLDLERIEAVAVGAVDGITDRPVILVDLIRNWMTPVDEPLRVVRLRSDRFDPRRLEPGEESPTDALRCFITRLLERSGATPLPDRRSVLGSPFAAFHSLAGYERAVLLVDDPSAQSR